MRIVLEPKIYELHNKEVICRLYNCDSDQKKIINTLYKKLQENNGIEKLKKQDKEYFYNSEKNFRLIAEINSEIVSSVVIMSDEDFERDLSVELYSVVTLDEYQGTGITKILFNYTFEWIKALRAKKVRLWTDIDNLKAQKFYEKVGFIELERDEKAVYYHRNVN